MRIAQPQPGPSATDLHTAPRRTATTEPGPMNQVVYNLSGTAAVVTGGGRGIGLAIATEFARTGAAVLLVDRDADVIRQAIRQLKDIGCVTPLLADVTDI